jgi:hypothetical protein
VALGYHTFSLYKSFLLDTVNVQKSDTLSVVAHVPLFFRIIIVDSEPRLRRQNRRVHGERLDHASLEPPGWASVVS